MTRKSILCAAALAVAGTVGAGATAEARWWGYGPGPYYYGPPAAYYGPRYYGPPPVYVAPPPVVYQRPPVVFEPGPDGSGPIRQCYVTTDRDRGFGYWQPC